MSEISVDRCRPVRTTGWSLRPAAAQSNHQL